MQKRILHIITTMDPAAGGVSQAVRSLVAEWNSQGMINEVLSMDHPSANYGDQFRIHKTGPGKTAWNYASQLVPWLRHHVTEYDVVILHGIWQYSSYALLKAIRSTAHTAFYVMPHGMLDPYFQKAKSRRLKAIRNEVFWKMIEGRLVRKADGLLFTCETEKLLARESFRPYTPAAEIVTGLAVDAPPAKTPGMSAAFDAMRPGREGRSYWLFLSRIHEKKGIDLLINAYKKLKTTNAALPDLVIAGPGLETRYGIAMRELAGNDSSIVFTGMIEGDTKWGAFYGADVFILPSHQENFGIAVVEALGCGTPVLISDKVNIWREIIGSGAGIVQPDTQEGTDELLAAWTGLSDGERSAMISATSDCFGEWFEKGQQMEKLKSIFKTDVPRRETSSTNLVK